MSHCVPIHIANRMGMLPGMPGSAPIAKSSSTSPHLKARSRASNLPTPPSSMSIFMPTPPMSRAGMTSGSSLLWGSVSMRVGSAGGTGAWAVVRVLPSWGVDVGKVSLNVTEVDAVVAIDEEEEGRKDVEGSDLLGQWLRRRGTQQNIHRHNVRQTQPGVATYSPAPAPALPASPPMPSSEITLLRTCCCSLVTPRLPPALELSASANPLLASHALSKHPTTSRHNDAEPCAHEEHEGEGEEGWCVEEMRTRFCGWVLRL
ncbi:hypothetical protein K439DRAFT_1621714 [Ramaria rubella]|nr:hypothetical protein K439DRAFT_1621714 [Ramaria rubella]